MGNVLATPEQQKVYLPVSVLYDWLRGIPGPSRQVIEHE